MNSEQREEGLDEMLGAFGEWLTFGRYVLIVVLCFAVVGVIAWIEEEPAVMLLPIAVWFLTPFALKRCRR